MSEWVLYGRPGWGSAIVEAQLAWYGLPFRYEACGDLFESEEARERLRPLNPLMQVPALQLPNGTVMTESAAITLHLADVTASHGLVSAPDDPQRAHFLRWLIFLVTNIYPTFTYADLPQRFVKTAGASEAFRLEVDAYQRRLWTLVESAMGAPYFLGDKLSALDLYLAVMTRWRPGPAWFSENTPLLSGAAQRASVLPAVAPVLASNFPPPKDA